ncbi:MAG TPA: hypothetical protein VKN18_10255 [Blastocatellia bacterium]|nr:hypothetical protein [Blastocatellia bacterium]
MDHPYRLYQHGCSGKYSELKVWYEIMVGSGGQADFVRMVTALAQLQSTFCIGDWIDRIAAVAIMGWLGSDYWLHIRLGV